MARHQEVGGRSEMPILHRGATPEMKRTTAANMREEMGHTLKLPKYEPQTPKGHQLNSIENSLLKLMKDGSAITPDKVGMARNNALIEKQPQGTQQGEATRISEATDAGSNQQDPSTWSSYGAADAIAGLTGEAFGAAGGGIAGAAKLGAKTAQKVGQAGVGAAKLGVGATKLGARGVGGAAGLAASGAKKVGQAYKWKPGQGGTPPAGTTPPGGAPPQSSTNLTGTAPEGQHQTMFGPKNTGTQKKIQGFGSE